MDELVRLYTRAIQRRLLFQRRRSSGKGANVDQHVREGQLDAV